MTLPGSPFVAYRGQDLFIEDVRAAALVAQHGSPLYAYSKQAMLAALAPYHQALQGRAHLVCYAVKANSNLAVLQTFAQAGCGFDIVSAGELARVLAAGGQADKVVFSGVGKTRSEMRLAMEAGVRCFNVESTAELEVLSAVASGLGRTARVSLRVNPDVDAGTHPYISTGLKGNKFGVAHQQAVDTYQRAAALPGIEVVGIDCHIGSQITTLDPLKKAAEAVVALSGELRGEGINLQFCWLMINFDIPWNPVRLEQRVGRIHRYGQNHTAQVYNLVLSDTIEGRIFFKRSCTSCTTSRTSASVK